MAKPKKRKPKVGSKSAEVSVQAPPGLDVKATFLIDAGRAVIGPTNAPEIQLATLDRGTPRRVRSLIVVQYEPQQFVARADANESFRVETDEWLSARGRRGDPGAFSSVPEDSPERYIAREADTEYIVRTGERAAIMFMSVHPVLRHLVARGEVSNLQGQMELVAQMPLVVLLDIMQTWKDVAEKLALEIEDEADGEP